MKQTTTSEVNIAANGDCLVSPTHEQISELAYGPWIERGCPEGSAEQNWYDAEARLRAMQESVLAGPDPIAYLHTSVMLGK